MKTPDKFVEPGARSPGSAEAQRGPAFGLAAGAEKALARGIRHADGMPLVREERRCMGCGADLLQSQPHSGGCPEASA